MEVQILADEGIPAGIRPDPAAEANTTTKSRGGGFRGKKKKNTYGKPCQKKSTTYQTYKQALTDNPALNDLQMRQARGEEANASGPR